jgi:hypothetical protein
MTSSVGRRRTRPVAVRCYRGVAEFTRRYWKRGVIGTLGLIVAQPLAGILSDTYADFLAAHFSRRHNIGVLPVLFGPTGYPNCSIFEVSLVPRQEITGLNFNLTFDQPVRSTLIRQVPLRDYTGEHGNQLKGDVSLKSPCDFKDETPTPDSAALSLGLSTDRTTVFIKAHDLIPEESREIVLLFYPDYAIEKWFPKLHQRTSYTAYHREGLPACLLLEPLHTTFGNEPYVPITGDVSCAPSDVAAFPFN